VLEEVELFVGGGSVEVLAVVDQVLFLLLSGFVGEGHAALFAKGGIGKHVVVGFLRWGDQGVLGVDHTFAADVADVVKEHVHQGEAAGASDDFVTPEGEEFEVVFLVAIQLIAVDQEVVGGEEKAAGAAGGISNFRNRP
jgi:hypothetical protein